VARQLNWIHEFLSGQVRGVKAACIRRLLWLASCVYELIIRLRNWNYDQGKGVHQAPVPVVSVGNLTVGGTGKTPTVEYLARFYRERDYQVCIISRGYGGSQGMNDEYLMLAETLPDVPHLQGGNRVELANVAVEELESELIILDDGFQHRKLNRDLNIVLIDATNPWGYGYLLPRGLLREPISSLRRADGIIITRADQSLTGGIIRRIKQYNRNAPIILASHAPSGLSRFDGETRNVIVLNQREVALCCGVGNPKAVADTLEKLGAKIVAERIFPDHHEYTQQDIESLTAWACQLPQDCWIITTHKDAVKIRLAELGGRELWTLQVRLKIIAGEDELKKLLLRGLSLA
jgi:tetraacyldisaccharide 4'-kinase